MKKTEKELKFSHRRFDSIELSPTKTGLFNSNVSKVGIELNDHLIAFQAISIQKHEIDKIKSDDRVNSAEYSINNANNKISRGIKLILFMLQERFEFIEQMREEDDQLFHIVKELLQIQEIEILSADDISFVSTNITEMKQLLNKYSVKLQKANQSLLTLDKRFLYTSDWRDILSKDQQNTVVLTLLQDNIQSISNALYQSLSKRQLQLQAIQESQDKNKTKKPAGDKLAGDISVIPELNDVQIQKLIEFLQSFSDQLVDTFPIQIKILCHLWIEDLIKVQAQYQKNLLLYTAFLQNFTGRFEGVLLVIKKIKHNILQIKGDNINSIRLLKMVELPQIQRNQNLSYQNTCQQQLIITKAAMIKLKKNIQELYQNLIVVQFLKEAPPKVLSDEEREAHEDFSFHELCNYDVRLLEKHVSQEVSLLSLQQENLQLEITALERLIIQVKDLSICEKKLRKASTYYMQAANDLKEAKQALINAKDYNKLNHKSLSDLSQFGFTLLSSFRMLQKYINQLQYHQSSIKELRDMMPLIGEFILMIDNFLLKAHLLVDLGISQTLIEYRGINDLIGSQSQLDETIRLTQLQSMLDQVQVMPDSDEEFEKMIHKQGFQPRVNNQTQKLTQNEKQKVYENPFFQ